MIIENVKIEITTEYKIKNTDKRKEPKTCINVIGNVSLDFINEESFPTIVDALTNAFEYDPVRLKVSFETSNI